MQFVPGASPEVQLATHRAGVATLTRGLGEPLANSGTVAELEDSTQRRRAAFRRRRYRQTAKVLISFAFGRYHRPVDEQLGLEIRPAVQWTMAGALAAINVYLWWWAADRANTRATALAIAGTLLFGGFLVVLLYAMRDWRRFMAPS